MLFNSYLFLFAFLPVCLVGFHLLARHIGLRASLGWLVACSLFFYGWWNPAYLVLMVGSIIFNFAVDTRLARNAGRPGNKALLLAGIGANLALIGYYKYASFFAANLNVAAGTGFEVGDINLRYCLFVTFFPQLIAGPIVHHSEMMPQFARKALASPKSINLAVGLTIFTFGLFKKAVLADGIAPYSDSIFLAAEQGAELDLIAARGGALAYTSQLYFDFSGYSDMAIGIARMFGIRLPVNFNSPYKAANIIDFWRRWHMTLSRFLRDYVYIPLGGSRRGLARRHSNLIATMLLGGLWHGAGWTFVIWGGLHGLYLIINHAWRALKPVLGVKTDAAPSIVGLAAARTLTFIGVVVGWVFFRATSLESAFDVLKGMAGLNGVSLPSAIAYRAGDLLPVLQTLGIEFGAGGGATFLKTWGWIIALALVAFFLPNTQETMRRYRPTLDHGVDTLKRFSWRPTPAWSAYASVLLAVGVLSLPEVSVFLYFQF